MGPQREWFDTDYYSVLGVPSSATDKDITRAYRKLAKQFHPDANPGNAKAEERFKEISAANDVLGDTAKRKEYDEVRQMVASGGYQRGPGGGPGGPGGFSYGDADLGDLFGNLFGAGRNAGFGGGRRSARTAPQRGQDLETELHLDFLEAAYGVTTEVRFTADAACATCNGTGAEPGSLPTRCTGCGGTGEVAVDQGPFSFSQVCPSCGGRGSVIAKPCKSCHGRCTEVRPREVKVKVPAGVTDSQRIRVKSRGAAGANGGPPGDLYVVVHVRAHSVFVRRGALDLVVHLPITFTEATLGANVKVPTLTDPVTLKVKAGTPSGTTQKVRGRGITGAKGKTGDLLVTFDVVVPTKPTKAQRAALEALGEAFPDDPRDLLGE